MDLKPKHDTKERVVKDVPPPVGGYLEDFWPEDGAIDLEKLKAHLVGEGRLSKPDAARLVSTATQVFKKEPNLLDVPQPVTVCGDVHGQFYDLMKLFEVGGDPKTTQYLFLGDYVDRGSFSVEVLLYMFALKINYPNTFWMLRGNHECRHLTAYFTFKEECLHKYDTALYDLCMDSFDALPLAAIMNGQFFCVHGGLSPSITTLEDVKSIDRFREPPQSGPLCDLLWSDPIESYGPHDHTEFEYNETRGCSYSYGFKAVVDFLDRNGLLCMIRAHEAQDHGYKMHAKHPETQFPTVITLFSAPNYLDAYGNKGAVMRYENTVMNIRQFNHSPHPYWLPNFMNVFTWSLPFVAEKVGESLLAMLKVVDEDEDEEAERKRLAEKADAAKPTDGAPEVVLDAAHKETIRRKILAASKMLTMMKTLRSEQETILQLKALAPGQQIPRGLLAQGPEAIRQAIGNFDQAKTLDKFNESWPKPEPSPQ